jgi:hypothetical protein
MGKARPFTSRIVVAIGVVSRLLMAPVPSQAQDAGARPAGADVPQGHQHETPQPGWTGNVDGVLFLTFNQQGGVRGSRDWRSQNWLMASVAHPVHSGRLLLSAMASSEPFTVGAGGYAEILQVGDAYKGLVNTDRQHPHELFSQLAVGWAQPVAETTVTFMAAPVGEASLGPPAFMHRASASENPVAPLSHHILDSTHVASSVVAGRVDGARWSAELSAFHGREPDEKHYGLDFGPLDSWSARVWLRPTASWTLQASHGFLKQPEQLEPGNQRRTNVSASWFKRRDSGFTAVTMAFGRNQRPFSTLRALLVEGTHRHRALTGYLRAERVDVETEALLFPWIVHVPHPGELVDPVTAITLGATRDVARLRGLSFGVGGDVTTYALAPLLRVTHGERPWSFHVFLRASRVNLDKRMFDMTMTGQGRHGHARH